MMKPPMHTVLGIAMLSLLSVPVVSFSQEPAVTGDKSVSFPQSYKCSTTSPCQNATGQIVRIEESYWITTPEGLETHLKVTRETKMEDIPKVGDKIGAQLTSNGEAIAVVKLAEIPKPQELPLPSHAQKDLRESQLRPQGHNPVKRSDAESSGKMHSPRSAIGRGK